MKALLQKYFSGSIKAFVEAGLCGSRTVDTHTHTPHTHTHTPEFCDRAELKPEECGAECDKDCLEQVAVGLFTSLFFTTLFF